MTKNLNLIKKTMKVVPDFPKKGISFKDITPIFANPKILKLTIKEMLNTIKGLKFDAVVGLESRGFWFAIPIATALNLPFVPVRKKGKLPRKTVSATYQLEYGNDTIQIHKNDIKPKSRVLIVDDVELSFSNVPYLENINLSQSTSSQMIQGKYLGKKTPEDILKLSKEAVECGVSHGAKIIGVNAEDASRSDIEYLITYAKEMKASGANRFRYCDTLGFDDPQTAYDRIYRIAKEADIDVETLKNFLKYLKTKKLEPSSVARKLSSIKSPTSVILLIELFLLFISISAMCNIKSFVFWLCSA